MIRTCLLKAPPRIQPCQWRYLDKVLGRSGRKCLDWHCIFLWVFVFINNSLYLALLALIVQEFSCAGQCQKLMLAHLWSGKTNIIDIDTKLCLCRLGHQEGQKAVPRASGGSEPARARQEPATDSGVVLKLRVGLSLHFSAAEREWEFGPGRKPRYWSRFSKVLARISA